MAGNTDLPVGFRAVGTRSGSKVPGPKPYRLAASQTLAMGDMVRLVSNYVKIASATATGLLGVVAEQGGVTRLGSNVVTTSATGAKIMVYDSEDIIYEGQTSGSITSSSAFIGKQCDLEGTTGIMEVNEDSVTAKVLTIDDVLIAGTHESRGNLHTGSNVVVRFFINKHQHGAGDAA